MDFQVSLRIQSLEQWIKVVKFANKNCIATSFTGDEMIHYENALSLAYAKKEITIRQLDSYIPLAEAKSPLDILRTGIGNRECEADLMDTSPEDIKRLRDEIVLIEKALLRKEMNKYYKYRN